jgi:hypothetical protein
VRKTQNLTSGQKQEQWSGSLSSKIKSKRWIVGEERGLGILIGIQPPYQSQLMCFSTLSGYGAEYKLHVELPLSCFYAERIAIFTNRLYPDKLGTPSTNPSRPFLAPDRILPNPTH